MKELLTSALSFKKSADNQTIIAQVEYTIGSRTEIDLLKLSAPSTQDVMKRVFLLNNAGMNILRVKFN